MDFRIPGLPHSAVKHAQSTSVRELIQKIENHPDRHALQQDLRQNQASNPFSQESKKMIQEVGNIELFELLETVPKTQCTACVSYSRHRQLHMWAFLAEGNSGQSKIRQMYDAPSSTPTSMSSPSTFMIQDDTWLHLTAQGMEGEQGWVLQGVLSRAIFRRPPVSVQKYFYSALFTYQQHLCQKKRPLPRSSSSPSVPP